MSIVKRFAGGLIMVAAAAFGLGGCMATSFVAMAVEQTPVAQGNCLTMGCASIEIAGYVYDKATEGDAAPCRKLNSVARALSVRCGYEVGSLDPRDVVASGLPTCPLTLATRDARLWPALPELVAKGATTTRCHEAPMAALAAADACPDFASASPDVRVVLRQLAETDPRAVQHDVMRMLSCPDARRVALDTVLDDWQAAGQLSLRVGFSPLSALHPSALESPLAHRLEAAGHGAGAAFGVRAGRLPSGFDLALRSADLDAIDWWLARMPELVDRVPSAQGHQNAWSPLARVVTPTYLVDPARQSDVVVFLLARGADPKRALPYEAGQSPVTVARKLKSPVLALLEAPRTPMAVLPSTRPDVGERLAALPGPVAPSLAR